MEYTGNIERLEAFEERADVELAALFAEAFDTDEGRRLFVSGEIRARSGAELMTEGGRDELRLEATAYNRAGRVIGTTYKSWSRRDFFAFQAFELTLLASPEQEIAKIRVYPK